jgi:hypothetical protein
LPGFDVWTRSFKRDDLFTANGSEAENKYKCKYTSKQYHNRSLHNILEENTVHPQQM